MRTTKTLTAIMVIATLCIINGCKKPQVENDKDPKVLASYTTLDNSYSGVTASDGLLWFDDIEAFQEVTEQIEANYIAWNEAFTDEYSELDEEDFNEQAENENYREDEAMFNFEALFTGDFISLRYHILEQEVAWLAVTPLDHYNDPDDYFIEDHILRTVLSWRNEIAIGNSIYKIYEFEVFEITDGDIETLEGLREDPDAYREESNVVVHDYSDGPGKTSCVNWGRTKQQVGSSSTYFKAKLAFNNYPFYSVIVAKSKAYKNNKLNKTSQGIVIFGSVDNPGCTLSTNVGSQKTNRVKKLKVRIPKWGGNGIRSRDKLLKSGHATYGSTANLEV